MPDIDNITINYSDTIDDVGINYINTIEDIDINYQSSIDNITLNLSSAIVTGAAVTSVNELRDAVVLTASAQLSLTSSSAGIYNHIFNHNLNYLYVSVNIFDTNNYLVLADVLNEDPNYVNIRAAVDLSGYKVVAQR
jgi:hypothetical protein